MSVFVIVSNNINHLEMLFLLPLFHNQINTSFGKEENWVLVEPIGILIECSTLYMQLVRLWK